MQLELWSESGEVADEAEKRTPRACIAQSTRAAYRTDWRLFERWCSEHALCALPASAQTLEQYLAYLFESGRKASTVRRARISIGLSHSERGLQRPDCDERIRALERTIAQSDSAGEKGAALTLTDLQRMASVLGNTLRDERDRALILLGFAGSLRSCELGALNVEHVSRTSSGLRLLVSHDGHRAAQVAIRMSRDGLVCPVRALERWLSRLPCARGALFRAVYGSRVTEERLAPRAVSRAVQRAAARAQLTADYSSHSLRSVFVGSAASSTASKLRAPRYAANSCR